MMEWLIIYGAGNYCWNSSAPGKISAAITEAI